MGLDCNGKSRSQLKKTGWSSGQVRKIILSLVTLLVDRIQDKVVGGSLHFSFSLDFTWTQCNELHWDMGFRVQV